MPIRKTGGHAAGQLRGWEASKEAWARLLKARTGDSVDVWNRRIKRERFSDKEALGAWLQQQGVAGYARSLLIMESFGYPAFLTASAERLIDAQYKDRAALRPIFDAIVTEALSLGEVVVQARKTYVSLVSQRRTFARIQVRGAHVDLGLRVNAQREAGRLQPSKIHETMAWQIRLKSTEDVDAELAGWLRRAFTENS